MILPLFYVDDIIKRALAEDINYVDISADYLIDENQRNDSYFVAKADGVLCGIDVAMRVFELLDPSFEKKVYFKDGDKIRRTALNLIQHMSGIATAANEIVELCKGTNAQITDTRKTVPSLRALQKYAVTCGGGKNHRFNLSDCAMLKDNHIDACGSITKAVETLRGKLGHTTKIEVETRDLNEVKEAAEAGADIIMLDNMDCDTMREAIKIIDGRARTEASGGITKENVREVAETGVDIISLGALTHSVKAFDISMKMK